MHACIIDEGWVDAIFCKILEQSTSPILFRSCEHEIPFSDQNEASKIGDSVLCLGVIDYKQKRIRGMHTLTDCVV
jgi:hypothetical protein